MPNSLPAASRACTRTAYVVNSARPVALKFVLACQPCGVPASSTRYAVTATLSPGSVQLAVNPLPVIEPNVGAAGAPGAVTSVVDAVMVAPVPSLPATSYGSIAKVYEVASVRPETVKLVVAVEPSTAPPIVPEWIRYPATPTLSVDASQVRVIDEPSAVGAARFCSAVGAVTSSVVADAVRRIDALPARSTASTANVYALASDRPVTVNAVVGLATVASSVSGPGAVRYTR